MQRSTASPASNHLKFTLASVLALVALGAAYSNHFDNGFHFDDSHVILNNLSIRSLENVPSFFNDATTFTARPQNASYRPLLTLSYAIDHHLGDGLSPRQFHRTQFGLLLLLGVLLTVFFRQVFNRVEAGSWNAYIALFGATLFCVHTANTETVNYLSSRSSLVATLGVVGSFVLYAARPRGSKSLLYLVPMVVGTLAKPLTIMFGPLLFVFVFLFEQHRSRSGPWRRGLAALWSATPALAVGSALYLFVRSMEPETLEYANVDRGSYAMTQPFVWLHYLRLFLLPRGLTADADWSFVETAWDPRLPIGLIFLTAMALMIVLLGRTPSLRPAAFGLAWFALALLPTSSIIPLSEVYNEHRIFFPFVGLALAASWAAARGVRAVGPGRSGTVWLAAGLALALIAAHGVGTYQRNRVWKNSETLWRDVTIKSPANGRGLMNYGRSLMRQGDLEPALGYFERALEFTPNYEVLEVNLAIVKTALDRVDESEAHFLRALELQPGYAQGRYFYAKWLKNHGRGAEAIEQLRRAVEISPRDLEANRLLLRMLAAIDDRRALTTEAQRILAIAPAEPLARACADGGLPFQFEGRDAGTYAKFARAKIGSRDWLDAAVLYHLALELDGEQSDSWNDLGWSLTQIGFDDLAVAAFRRALEVDPDMELAQSNLNWVLQGKPER